LRGGPVKTVGLSGSLAKFDVLNNGHPIQTGWTTLGEGFLVFDPSDAPVTKESQLIGSFAALEKLDPTANGVLTPNDPLWSDLRVWEPSANGAFSAGDLYTLSQLGIASIGLTSTAVDQNSNGNTILRQGAFTYTNGAAGQMASVELSADVPTSEASHARDTEPVAAKLGNLVAAMGSFHPLEQSTALDPRPHATDTYPILAASHSG